MRALEHADRELGAGRPWRAKEILQGSIPNAGYDRELFEKLGVVLLKMGDLREAGRYLFLSSRREPAYGEAISIFLFRHKKNPRALYSSFPRVAKLAVLSDYAEPLRGELKQLGFPEVLSKKGRCTLTDTGEVSWIPAAAGWLFGLSILATFVLGLVKILEILYWFKKR
jgi:Family of unknown function (DUF6584)